jgi:hypothetical protein
MIEKLLIIVALVSATVALQVQQPVRLGQPFPKPQSLSQTDKQFSLDARVFSFHHAQDSVVCDLITNAFNRYYKIIFKPAQYAMEIGGRPVTRARSPGESSFPRVNIDQLERVVVKVETECENYPSLDSNESCKTKYICALMFIVHEA